MNCPGCSAPMDTQTFGAYQFVRN